MKWPRFPALLLAVFLLLMLSGCTQAQVDRAEQAVAQAKEYLARAEAAEAMAKQAQEVAAKAVLASRALADQLGNDAAKEVVSKAEAALAQSTDALTKIDEGVQIARVAAENAQKVADAAKASQAAGGSTVDVLIAIVGVFVPAAGVAAMAIKRQMAASHALQQTVAGVSNVRASMSEADWKAKIAPILSAAQDESVQNLITKTIADHKIAALKDA